MIDRQRKYLRWLDPLQQRAAASTHQGGPQQEQLDSTVKPSPQYGVPNQLCAVKTYDQAPQSTVFLLSDSSIAHQRPSALWQHRGLGRLYEVPVTRLVNMVNTSNCETMEGFIDQNVMKYPPSRRGRYGRKTHSGRLQRRNLVQNSDELYAHET